MSLVVERQFSSRPVVCWSDAADLRWLDEVRLVFACAGEAVVVWLDVD